MYDLKKSLIDQLSPEFAPYAAALEERSKKSFVKVSPKKTLSVSLTGLECRQNCAHCNGHYLKGMLPFQRIFSKNLDTYDSILISGGSEDDGSVDFSDHKESILKLPEHLSLNIHPGFQSVENLSFLRKRNVLISFDLPANNKVIKKVFKLGYSLEDYQKLYIDFTAEFRTVPHLTLGLSENLHEEHRKNLELLAKMQPEKLVILIFRPTPDTEMASRKLPFIPDCIDFVKELLQNLSSQILIGCMRPSGLFRRNFDILAWLSGINHFVHPAHDLKQTLEKAGIEIIEKNNCCAL